MTPQNFKEANASFGPPQGMAESQVQTIPAFSGAVEGGSCDGCLMVVTAWKPDEQELADLEAGGCVYLVVLGGLPPHFLTTRFDVARRVA